MTKEITVTYRSFKPTKSGYKKALAQCSETVQAEHKECSEILWKDIRTEKWSSNLDNTVKHYTRKRGNKATAFIVANGQLFVYHESKQGTRGSCDLFATEKTPQDLDGHYWRIEVKEDEDGEGGKISITEDLGVDAYVDYKMRSFASRGYTIMGKRNLYQLGIAGDCGLSH